MKRAKLAAARAKKYWTLEQAAEQIGVDTNTLYRWEKGRATPRAYNIQKMCEVYEATASGLDLEDDEAVADGTALLSTTPITANVTFNAFLDQDLTLRLMNIIWNWPRRNSSYHEFQGRIIREIEDYMNVNHNTSEIISRRNALRRLASLPFVILGLTESGPFLKHPVEEILTHCASGIIACWELSKGHDGQDVLLAFSGVSTYLPTLKAIVKGEPLYHKAAASLAGQCTLLKTVLGWHTESLDKAMGYASEAITYSREAEDIPLQIAIHTQLSWIYYYARQWKSALEEIEKAARFLQSSTVPFPPSLYSSVYSTLAIRQAMYGQDQQAVTSLRLAHEYFFKSPVTESRFIYVDYDHPSLVLEDGMAHTHLHLYDAALDSFSQIVNSNDLSSKMPVAERIRIEALNNQAVALLKSPKKDMEQAIYFWTAGIQGAKALQSEQRFSEALLAYEIMEGIWSNEKRIKNLRELTEHW